MPKHKGKDRHPEPVIDPEVHNMLAIQRERRSLINAKNRWESMMRNVTFDPMVAEPMVAVLKKRIAELSLTGEKLNRARKN